MAAPAQTPPASTAGQAGATATAAAAVPTVVGLAAPAAGIALAGAGAVAAAAIMATLVKFLAALAAQHRKWLAGALARYGVPDDVAQVASDEMRLEREFARNSANRVAAQLPAALAIRDPEQRAAAVRAILDAEQRFAQQRQQAMMERAIAAMERLSVRRISPLGAYWKLGIAMNHTEGCRFMAGKFWPWAVLDRVHPPRHHGCTSSLHSFGEAIHNGWMTAGDVPDTRQAIAAASGVVMEGEDADALLREVGLREQLVELGVSAERFQSIEWEGLHGSA